MISANLSRVCFRVLFISTTSTKSIFQNMGFFDTQLTANNNFDFEIGGISIFAAYSKIPHSSVINWVCPDDLFLRASRINHFGEIKGLLWRT